MLLDFIKEFSNVRDDFHLPNVIAYQKLEFHQTASMSLTTLQDSTSRKNITLQREKNENDL